MPIGIVTGSGGLVGSEAVAQLVRDGHHVIGLDNDMRARFFGPEASTAAMSERLGDTYDEFSGANVDIRDAGAVDGVFSRHASEIEVVIHAAAQPSHDWAATDPQTDFGVNANGTLNLLESTRRHCPDATFVFVSTNKVYGDRPNQLPLEDMGSRLDLAEDHRFFGGIDISMSIDGTMHSLFGASKAAADLLVQEYGRYFGMPTACFRAGCLTGPNHAGTRLHGFLAYLMKCTVTGTTYKVLGYDGKQVRDNLHSEDLVNAFLQFHRAPRQAAVYNLGGGRDNSCSMREAIEYAEQIGGTKLQWKLVDEARRGDHRWWISDLSGFKGDYPEWEIRYDLKSILVQIHDANVERWRGATA